MKQMFARFFPPPPPVPERGPTMDDHDHPLLMALVWADGSVCVRCVFTDSVDVANYPDFDSFLASPHRDIRPRSYPTEQHFRDEYLARRVERAHVTDGQDSK